MARKKNEKQSKYDYNIYSIPADKYDEFVEYLQTKQFEFIPLRTNKQHAGVKISLYFCGKDNKKGLQWIDLLSECSENDLEQRIKVYGAVMIYRNEGFCYVSSYGNAHFYASAFCNYSFGTDIAERLVDLNSVKAQQNVSHGNKLSKTHVDYIRNTVLTYGSGEIPTYIRGKSNNSDKWGEVINCGVSAQFKWTEKPLGIGNKLVMLYEELQKPAKESLPRLMPLDDDNDIERIASLNTKLAKAISEYDPKKDSNSFVNVPSFYLLGTKIVQNDIMSYKLSCNYKSKEINGELSLGSIIDFLDEKSLDIMECIEKIKIQVQYSSGEWSPPNQPMMKYLEYVSDDNFCLRDGKWWQFNKAYLAKIINDLSKLEFENHLDDMYEFDKIKLIEYAKQKGICKTFKHQPYETYYNEKLSETLNLKCVHPNTTKFEEGENLRIELCDLYDENNLYFVKYGTPNEFAYAIDQASITLDRIVKDYSVLVIDNERIIPKTFCLILIFHDRKTMVTDWKKVKSLNFLMHLSELKARLGLSGFNLRIEFVYQQGEIVNG